MRVAVALVAALLAATPAVAPPSAVARPPALAPAPAAVDVHALVHEAQAVQREDALAWARYRFHREVRATRLDEAGAVLQESVQLFEIMPLTAGGFDERILRLDGREPTQAEVTQYREEATFTRHYATLTAVDGEGDEVGGFSLATLLRMADYTYVGVETVDGVAAHRLDFQPDPAPHGSGAVARLTQAMGGSLWLTVEGAHLVRARAAIVQPVSLYLGLGKVHSLEVLVEAAPAGPGARDVYLPQRLTISTNLRVFFSMSYRRRTYSYSDFTLVTPPPAGEAAHAGGPP